MERGGKKHIPEETASMPRQIESAVANGKRRLEPVVKRSALPASHHCIYCEPTLSPAAKNCAHQRQSERQIASVDKHITQWPALEERHDSKPHRSPPESSQESRSSSPNQIGLRIMKEHCQVDRHNKAENEADAKYQAPGRLRLTVPKAVRFSPSLTEEHLRIPEPS